MNSYLDMWKHSEVITPELFPKYKTIMDTQLKNHSAKLSDEEQSVIEKSLYESILKKKVISLALLDPFDDSYIKGVVVEFRKTDSEIVIRNDSNFIKIPIILIIGIL